MNTNELAWDQIPQDVRNEAAELARGCVKLEPDGVLGLARKLMQCRKEERPLRVKLGVDPNMKDMHIGHGVVLRRLRRFQDFGHTAVLILGGCTATVGNPTGRLTGRPELSDEAAQQNIDAFLEQLPLLLDMKRIEILNNADWLNTLPFVWVMKNLKRLVTVNELLSRFKDHLDGDDGTSGLRSDVIDYPFLQGWDSVHVRADVEIGGIDQLSNLLMGRKFQPHFGQEPQICLMLPLLLGLDGERKMSKSFGNSIGLRDEPDDMFGKCMRIQDNQIISFFELATSAPAEEVDREKAFLTQDGNPRDAKQRLATRLVLELHGEGAAQEALARWKRVHTERLAPVDMPSHVVAQPTGLIKILVDTGLAPSNTMARKQIKGSGVKIDGTPVADDKMEISLTAEQSLVLSFGKRFVRLVAAS